MASSASRVSSKASRPANSACSTSTSTIWAERARTQEPAGLKKAQAVPIARVEEVSAIAIMQAFCDLLARSVVGPVLGEKIEKVARDFGAQALAQQPQRRARPVGIALRGQREIEQPLAG